jgi:hypothetical protein
MDRSAIVKAGGSFKTGQLKIVFHLLYPWLRKTKDKRDKRVSP